MLQVRHGDQGREGAETVNSRPMEASEEGLSSEVCPVQVRVSSGICEGWGQCHRWASDVYPLDEDGFIDVHVMEVPSELAEQATWRASACPVRAITVIGPPLDYWIERRRTSGPSGKVERTAPVASPAGAALPGKRRQQ